MHDFGIITKQSEIPAAPHYVVMDDSFMGGWGDMPKTNTIIFPCRSYDEAVVVRDNAKRRREMKRVRIVSGSKPKLARHGHTYQIMHREQAARWYTPGGFGTAPKRHGLGAGKGTAKPRTRGPVKMSERRFLEYLTDTIIPDTLASGRTFTAEDLWTVHDLMGAHEYDGDFVEYLEGTLIPDLRESGSTGYADDFATGAAWIKSYRRGAGKGRSKPRRAALDRAPALLASAKGAEKGKRRALRRVDAAFAKTSDKGAYALASEIARALRK